MSVVAIDPERIVRERGLDPADWWASEIAYREWRQGERPCYSLKAKLRPRNGPEMARKVERALRGLGVGAPRVKAGGGILGEIHLNDAHVGAWENGDVRAHAKSLYLTATRLADRLVALEKGLVERFLLVVNGDWLHCDTVRGETTKGTRLEDVGIPYEDMFEQALGCLVGIANYLAYQKPLEVQVIPGNHDFHSLYAVGQALRAVYKDAKRVEVECTTEKYRYVRWGTVLLGLAHGDTGKLRDLPGLMASDRREDWGQTTWHEWHTGHAHADAVLEKGGCRMRSIPALCARNAWSRNQGYSETTRGAEAFLWHRERGYLGHLHEGPA